MDGYNSSSTIVPNLNGFSIPYSSINISKSTRLIYYDFFRNDFLRKGTIFFRHLQQKIIENLFFCDFFSINSQLSTVNLLIQMSFQCLFGGAGEGGCTPLDVVELCVHGQLRIHRAEDGQSESLPTVY